MRGERKSLFIFLMGLAWKFRFSMPLLLSSTVALLGRAWMFQIRVQSMHGLHEHEHLVMDRALPIEYGREVEMSYYEDDENEAQEDEEVSWETDSTDSWETLVEEVAYG